MVTLSTSTCAFMHVTTDGDTMCSRVVLTKSVDKNVPDIELHLPVGKECSFSELL